MKKIFLIIGLSLVFLILVSNVVDLKPTLINNKHINGIDISHYNKVTDWKKIKKSNQFVIIKSTEGSKFVDNKFKTNWNNAKNHGITRGAYHFFNPNVPAIQQFNNFKRNVTLSSGDLPPILDVELKEIDMNEVNKWCELAEKHYGVKPIIYSDYLVFKFFMDGKVNNYKLWIHIDEKYSVKPSFNNYDCIMWQYSHTGRVDGIQGDVDLNTFLGDSLSFEKLKK